ncbi:hypothetical protein [Anaerobacillus sp. CMMVII]|nr:hypothetical protein [Anaerobacillus sp. CMMVII]
MLRISLQKRGHSAEPAFTLTTMKKKMTISRYRETLDGHVS